MARWRGTTTERGYGASHQAERKRRLALWKPGDLCARCGQPMWQRWRTANGSRVTAIDLGHDHVNGGYLGLEHHDCNRGDGASRSNRMRPLTKATAAAIRMRPSPCKTCGQPYTRAARRCEICGRHYHPSYGEQRTCSRSCGVQLQRQNKMACGWLPKELRPLASRVYIRPCDHCNELFVGRRKASKFCSRRCHDTYYNWLRRGGVPQWVCICGVQLPAGRKKCDDCVRQAKRERKRRGKRTPAARASEARREARRRRRRSAERPPAPRPCGSATPQAKLTEEIVRECRARHAAGETQRELAAEHGISQPVMGSAIRGKTWRHVT